MWALMISLMLQPNVSNVKKLRHLRKLHRTLQLMIPLRLQHVMMTISQLKVSVMKILKAFIKGKSRIKMGNIITLTRMVTQCIISMMVYS